MGRSVRIGAVAMAVSLVAVGCTSHTKGDGTAARAVARGPKGAWVGEVAGTNALVALVSDGVELTAYLCDGSKRSTWFAGLTASGKPQLVADDGSALDVTLTKDRATGRLTTNDGRSATFTAASSRTHVLFRAAGSIDGHDLLGGWIVGPGGEQRGAINFDTGIIAAPTLTTTQITASMINLSVDMGTRTSDVVASAVVPDSLNPPTINTSGFREFVFVGLGDSFGAGNGNPFKPANLTVGQSALTPWDKLAVSAGAASVVAPAAGPIGLGLQALASAAFGPLALLAAGARVGGETSVPELPGITDPGSNEQWGGDATHPTAPADETYRVFCHRGKSTSEKVFERVSADPKYSNITFVYYNFACSGTQIRHIFNQPYDGDNDPRFPNVANRVPPELDQLRVFLGDQSGSTSTATARTFNTDQHVVAPHLDIPHVDAAYISTGGNDAGFADVILRCTILPLPDCGSGERARVDNGAGGIQQLGTPSNPDLDSDYFGLNSLPSSYNGLANALNGLSMQRGPNPAFPTSNIQTFGVAPTRVYIGEYPDPIKKDPTTGTMCDSSSGPLRNDTMGLGSQVDAAFADRFLGDLDTAVDNAVAAHAAPRADGRGGWTAVPNAHAFDRNGICLNTRFVNTGADALKLTGNDLGAHNIFDISAAIAHPNNSGYEALANGLEPLIRAQLDGMIAAVPARPLRVRQVGARLNSEIDLRWDDKANNESTYQVLSRPAGSTADFTPATLQALPSNAEEFRDVRVGARTDEYKVRVCSRFGKCSESDTIVATNEAPVPPAGLKANFRLGTFSNNVVAIDVSWTPQPKNPDVKVVIRAQVDTSDRVREFLVRGQSHVLFPEAGTAFMSPVVPASEFHLTQPIDPNTPGNPLPNSGTYTIRVRGCNILGCSSTSDAVTVNVGVPTLSGSQLTIPKTTTTFTTIKP